MGFDPVLVPLYHRPFAYIFPGDSDVNWQALRVTNRDFEPSLSCAWLYRSLSHGRRRGKRFTALAAGARSTVPMPDVTI
jgi:hypothetical protein